MRFPHWMIEIGFSLSLIVNALLFIPQIIAMVRNRSAQGVSLITFLGFNIIQLFTISHGFIVSDYTLVVGFILSFITCGTVTCLIFYYNYFKR